MTSTNTVSLNRIKQLFLFGILTLIAFSACNSTTIEERDVQGNLVATYQLKDNVKHGTYIGYHPDGSIFDESTYVKGKVHGTRSLYYEGSKKIQTLETYVNGIMDGPLEEYHLNGQLSFTGLYVSDQMEGVWKKYNETGQLLEEVTFRDSEENGPFKEYHINGQLAAEGSYLNGDNEHGLLKIFNEKGELIKKMECSNGICQTTWPKNNLK